jgi:predicted DNA-binding transcriptional regulator AlpA
VPDVQTASASDVLTAKETSQEYGIPEPTLTDWRYKSLGPPYVRLGPKSIRYRRRDIEAWLEANTVRPAGTRRGAA